MIDYLVFSNPLSNKEKIHRLLANNTNSFADLKKYYETLRKFKHLVKQKEKQQLALPIKGK
ncbi:hypothetical protein [Helicobacter suis]|uniref:hypothetical protein n=1 Tax=Helicobacter suis TaxID=104628 RepID=UPI0013D09073|nr:hypothetical protein [Helicobacter suis]